MLLSKQLRLLKGNDASACESGQQEPQAQGPPARAQIRTGLPFSSCEGAEGTSVTKAVLMHRAQARKPGHSQGPGVHSVCNHFGAGSALSFRRTTFCLSIASDSRTAAGGCIQPLPGLPLARGHPSTPCTGTLAAG